MTYRPMVEIMPLNGTLRCYCQEFEVYSPHIASRNTVISVWSTGSHSHRYLYTGIIFFFSFLFLIFILKVGRESLH